MAEKKMLWKTHAGNSPGFDWAEGPNKWMVFIEFLTILERPRTCKLECPGCYIMDNPPQNIELFQKYGFVESFENWPREREAVTPF